MGKSQIALEFCHRNKENYRYIFWMEADTETALQNSFVDAARMLSLPALAAANSAKPEEVVPRMIQWFHDNNEWLLVFDNADDYSLGNAFESRRLQNKYFPKKGQGIIVITTRNDFAGQAAVNLNDLKMDNDTALKLLLRDNATATSDNPSALAIVQELGYLPLAVDLAGAFIMREGCTPAEFLEKYKNRPADYLGLTQTSSSDYEKTVSSVWNVSFDRIKDKDPLAAGLLRSIAFVYPDNIPLALFKHHAQTILDLSDAPSWPSLSAAIKLLGDFSLVRRTVRKDSLTNDPAKDTLTIHRLVQTVILLKIEPSEKLLWCKRLISALNREVPTELQLSDENSRRIMEAYVPQVLHVAMQFKQYNEGYVNPKTTIQHILQLMWREWTA